MRKGLYLAFLILFIGGCKKDKDKDPVPPVVRTDWAAELKNSVWSGEMQNTVEPIMNPLYCSIAFNSDNTLHLTEVVGNHPGIWAVQDSTLIMDFGGTIIRADLGKQSWKNIPASGSNQFNLFSANRSVAFDPAVMAGTKWKGSLLGYALELEFTADQKVKVTHAQVAGPSTFYLAPYVVYGSGVFFSTPYSTFSFGLGYYGCLFNNATELRGTGRATLFGSPYITTWKVIKQ